MNINSKPKIWAPYQRHKTYSMFKDNIWERLAADDMQSVHLLISHLRRLLGDSTDGIVQCWIKEYKLGYSLDKGKVVEHATV